MAIRDSTYALSYRVSLDDGATFSPITTMPMPLGTNSCSNTSLAADAHGGLYLAWGCEMSTTSQGRSNQHVYVATSRPGQTSFGDPVEVTDPALTVGAYDQPRIGIAQSGALVVIYSEWPPDLSSSTEMVAYSEDGIHFTRAPLGGLATMGQTRNFARVCQSSSSSMVWVALFDADAGVVLFYSEDGGKTWPEANRTIASDPTADGALSFSATACAAAGSEVWILYALSSDPGSFYTVPKLSQLRLAHSSDGGRTIDWRSTVGDTAAAPYFMVPLVAHDDRGGVDLVYYAGATDNDPAATALRKAGKKAYASPIPQLSPALVSPGFWYRCTYRNCD